MVEHYGLSEAQKGYLNGTKELSNESKERKAITRKSLQAWSIFKPLLESKVVSDDFKYQTFGEIKDNDWERFDIPKDRFTFRHFLNSLLDTDAENPASKEIYKMGIAKMLIEKSITYYQTRFRNNQLVYDKFAEFSDFMKMLQEIYDQEVNNLVKADFIRLRKNMPRPPRIEPNEFWHALCMQCFSYSFHVQAKSKDESRESIKHTKDCPFEKEFTTAHEKQKDDLILDFIHFVEPKTK
jgi:hypothetical protein